MVRDTRDLGEHESIHVWIDSVLLHEGTEKYKKITKEGHSYFDGHIMYSVSVMD